MSDRDTQMLPFLQEKGKKVSKLTQVEISKSNRKSKVLFVLFPMWAYMFPPYNLARLASITKNAGYETEIMDFNIESYNHAKNSDDPFVKELWGSLIDRWRDPKYFNEKILPHFEDIFDDFLERILEYDPDVLGISEYNFSEGASHWFLKRIRKWAPHIKLVGGGPNFQFIRDYYQGLKYYDYVVSGEAETNVLRVLQDVENGREHKETQIYKNPLNLRIDLNNMPLPDYCSLDLNLYGVPNGINSEFSRGCVAKCTFCSETHFHKYRQREAISAFDEIKYFHETQGTSVVYFVDSLINGNLKELRDFAEKMKVFDKKVQWLGYARHDGRMDLEYMQDLAAGGCIGLNFGCESASQKVLDFMDKKVKVEDMEQNFRDITKVGIYAWTNWIQGFPTEKAEDNAKSMEFIHRVRNSNLRNLSLGHGFSPMEDNIVGQNPPKFNLSNFTYAHYWLAKDHSMAGPSVLMRVKTMKVFADNLLISNPYYDGHINSAMTQGDGFSVKFHDEAVNNEIEYDNFDYNLIKKSINPLADSLVNEIWPLIRLMWRTRGGFDLEFKVSPDEFTAPWSMGGKGLAPYDAKYIFSIDKDGNWEADFDLSLEQPKWPFGIVDYSKHDSNSALRAKQLAKPEWGMGEMPEDMRKAIRKEADRLNQEVDFSFDLKWKQKGNWHVSV